jgi:putative membrane protein
MLNTEIPEQSDSAKDWQHSSIWAMLPLLVKAVTQWVGVIAGGAYLSSTDRFEAYAPYGITGLALLILGSAFLHWRFTVFRVSTLGIELRRGVLKKEHLLLAKSRIQELQVQQPFYFRPLQLFTVSLDSAGSQQQEFYLTGLTSLQLASLQGGGQGDQTVPSTPLLRIWLATLYNKHLWLPLLAVSGALLSQLDGELFQSLFAQGREVLHESGLQQSFALQIAASVSLLLLIALVLLLMTLIWLYPQRFSRDERQLQLLQGTLLKKSQRIQAKRVQMLTVSQPWLARLFGHFSLIFHGFTNSREQKSKFALLGQTGDDINQQLQAQQLLALSDIRNLPFQPYAQVYFRRLLWLRGIMILVLSLVLALFWQAEVITLSFGLALCFAAALWLLADLWAYRRWHGFYLQQQVLYLWHGGMGQFWQIVPLQQVQKVQLVQSLFFRQQQLVQVQLSTANGSVTLAAIPNQQAQELYAQVLKLRPECGHGLLAVSARIDAG